MKFEDLGPLAWEALGALTAHYGPAINHTAEELGIPYGEWYGWLMAARIFEPEPVSAARLQVRSAYTSPATLGKFLARGAELGLLSLVGPGEYRLTQAGHAGVQHLIDSAYAAMTQLQPLPAGDLDRLADLLYRLVQACLAAPEPPTKYCLPIERHYDPGVSAPAMVRMDQYLSDLAAYRDDAHLTTWRTYDVSGQAWEALTALWRGGPLSLVDLAARLARRGYTRDEYAAALDELARRDWVTQDGEVFRVTEAGQQIRADAEATTDQFFYAPWGALNARELAQLHDLLVRFRDRLRESNALHKS